MKSISKKDIKIILNQQLEHLIDAISNGKNPYHTFTLGTLNANQSEIRTVVLRNIEKEPLRIFFNADYRSPKVAQLLKNSNCSALFYSFQSRAQIRFKAEATVHYDNKISKSIWKKTPLQSRKCYMGDFKPSKYLESWDPNIPSKYLKTDPQKKDSESGFKNFTYIELNIIETDILKLHHDGHIRFKIDKKNRMEFVAP
tara:strand:+ start:336 stop:932 length:597 start_codon:yes stop_codon:yes gene_type:complete